MLFAQAVSTTVHKNRRSRVRSVRQSFADKKAKTPWETQKMFPEITARKASSAALRKNRKDIHPIRYRVDDRLVLRARFLPHSRASDRKSRILLRSVSSVYGFGALFHSPVAKLVQKISDSGISSLDPGDRYSRILHGACHVQNMACALVGLHYRFYEHRRFCLSEKRSFLRGRSADTNLHS